MSKRLKEASKYLKNIPQHSALDFKIGDIIAKKALLLTSYAKWYTVIGTERVETPFNVYDYVFKIRELKSGNVETVPSSFLLNCVKYDVWESVEKIIKGENNV